MRGHAIIGALLGCGQVQNEPADAPIDTAGCQPRPLLIGGTMVEPQGWSVVTQLPATITYGPDDVRLETSTTTGATTSGQLLLSRPGALPPPPFKLQVVLLVERVDPHNPFDAAVAILGSFTPPFGAGNDRNQIIYLDGGSIGWADDSQMFTSSILDNTFHTLELSVDANTVAQVKLDGAAALSRSGYLSNGTIAIGDQTNDRSVDSAIRIRSVTLLCP